MATITVNMRDLPQALRRDGDHFRESVSAGVRVGLQRGRALMVRLTPVDMGIHRAAWRVRPGRMGETLGELVNDAPMIGVLEGGARPHPVSRAGIEAITQWAMRKMAVDEKTARGIAFAIAKKLKTQGQRGLFFVRDNRGQIQRWVIDEVRRQLARGPRR